MNKRVQALMGIKQDSQGASSLGWTFTDIIFRYQLLVEFLLEERSNEIFVPKLPMNYYDHLLVYKRTLFIAAIRQSKGNITQAAKLLHLPRKTFYQWMREFSITEEIRDDRLSESSKRFYEEAQASEANVSSNPRREYEET